MALFWAVILLCGFGSEAPDSIYSFEKKRQLFSFYKMYCFFLFYVTFLRAKKVTKEGTKGRRFRFLLPFEPQPPNDRGGHPLRFPPLFAVTVLFNL